MSWRSILIIIGILLHPAVSLWAQQDVLRFHDVSVADALTTINEHYPDNSIHFVRNELDTLRIATLTVKGQDVLDDITRIIGKYPIRLKIFGNHIFVEYKHDKTALGNVPLLSSSAEEDIAFSRILQEVMVSQGYPLLDMDGSMMSLRIADTPLALAGSASDLLYYLPGIHLEAHGTMIRIDGKPVTSYSELAELDSKEIERIDYTDQPQFSSRQHMVIDIRTNRRHEDGYGIHMTSQYSQGIRGRAMQLVKTNVRQGEWELQASGTYRYDGILKALSVNQSKFEDSFEQNSFHLNLGSEYRLSPCLTLGVQYQLLYMLNPVRQKRDNLIFNYDSHNMLWESNLPNLQSMQYIRDWQLDYQPMHDLNVYLKSRLGRWEVNAAGSFYHDGVNLSELDVTNPEVDHRSNNVMNTLWATKVEANRSLWHGYLQMMAEYSYTDRQDIYHRSDTMPQSSLLRQQQRWSGSIAYRRQTRRINATMGLLMEHIDTYSDFQHVFPFANICYLGQQAKFTLAYAMRSSMPTYGQTNGYTYHNIEILGVEGQPNLTPSLSHNLTLKTQIHNFVGQIGWQRVTDFIAQSVESKDGEFVVNYRNIDVARLYDATLNYHHSLRHWTSQYTVTLQSQQIKDDGKSFDLPVLGLQWNNQIQFPYGISAMLNASFRSSGHEGATWQGRTGRLDLSLTKETRYWTLQLRADDLLRSAATRILYYGKDSEYFRRCYADSQRFQLTLRIHLGSLSRHTLQVNRAGVNERERF